MEVISSGSLSCGICPSKYWNPVQFRNSLSAVMLVYESESEATKIPPPLSKYSRYAFVSFSVNE